MQQIKQSTETRNLVFYMVASSDHVTPLTGAAPTVLLSKNGGAFNSPVGAVTEISGGFYKVAANATDVNTLGILALSATATGGDAAAMAYEVVANIESDSIAAISAVPASVWGQTVPASYADGTAGAAVGRLNNTPAEAPVLVVPAPDEDDTLTVCYIYTESITNTKRSGIRLSFSLTEAPARSERVLEIATAVVKTDINGFAQISLQRGLEYRVFSEELKLRKLFTPTGETFNLLDLVP